MPEFWFWGLLASIILLAIGTTLHAARSSFMLQMANQVIKRLWQEINALDKRNNQGISRKSDFVTRINPKISENTKDSKFPFHEILTSVAEYNSQKIPATPKLIANDIGLDPEITLAYMWKYHNEQYISFRSGGSKPGINTPFFLSPKAMTQIKIIKAEQIT